MALEKSKGTPQYCYYYCFTADLIVMDSSQRVWASTFYSLPSVLSTCGWTVPPDLASNNVGGGDCGVCVGVFSSHSFWKSSSLDVPAGVTQEECHTEFLINFFLRCVP